MSLFNNINETVGNTPLVKLNQLTETLSAEVYVKCEFFNPLSCIKERIAKHMVEVAERDGHLKPGGVIIESTSGNTGLGLAMVAASRGYKLIITMPETMSVERRSLLKHLGAEVILTPGDKGMSGAIQHAEDLLKETPNAFMPRQFDNPANPEVHYLTTGKEIWEDTEGNVDIFVSGVGTGGTLTGAGRYLKEQKETVKVVAVEPKASAVLSGKEPGKHGIQGIGAGFIPTVLDKSLIDKVIPVTDQNAIKTAKQLAAKEGILCGISSGAAAFAALQEARKAENKGKIIVTILPDTGERYLSTGLMA
jgi:cysteine synthase A